LGHQQPAEKAMILKPLTGGIDIPGPLRYVSDCPKIAIEIPILDESNSDCFFNKIKHVWIIDVWFINFLEGSLELFLNL